jgi:hypothetical protein
MTHLSRLRGRALYAMAGLTVPVGCYPSRRPVPAVQKTSVSGALPLQRDIVD